MTGIYVYWASTGLLSLLYLSSAVLYIAKKEWVRKTLTDFGYPAYLVPLLAGLKLLAVMAVLGRFSVPVSDLAYAGMFFHLLLSGLAHIGVHKPRGALPAVIGLVLLLASFATQNLARSLPSPYGMGASAGEVVQLKKEK